TKHSSLSRGGAPLLGQLEIEAEQELGPLARWWARLACTRPRDEDVATPSVGVPPGAQLDLQVVAARLDPLARFAFRVDMPRGYDAEQVLGAICAVSDDAAFPGYPYPLAVADRLASCPPWLRHEVRVVLDEHLDRAGVSYETRERAFADRHRMMERA
ncbi:MAG: DNA double-strand break repair nuclease NurA, partial [Mycobacterium sp.]